MRLPLALLAACFLAAPLRAQIPQLINYQGRVAVGGANFNGSGQFKFALVNTGGTVTYWSNDGSSVAAASRPPPWPSPFPTASTPCCWAMRRSPT